MIVLAEWHEKARAMRAEDPSVSLAEIGRWLGKDRRTVSDFFRRPSCVACGDPCQIGATQCRACEDKMRHEAREERLEWIAQMYDSGMPIRAIVREMGWAESSAPPEINLLLKRGRIVARYAAVRERHS